MFIAALAVLVCTIYAQYPPPPPYPPKLIPPYDGNSRASMCPSSSSSSYYLKPPYEPTYYPEYFPVYVPVEEYCDYCPRVTWSCKDSEECFKPTIEYLESHCKAVVSCDSFSGNVLLVANKEDILGEGIRITKLIQCQHGKWTARDVYGDYVKFSGLSCLSNVPVK
uniref:C6 domain-containing protein n=1 Tax=Angiostrongylus cantonensis TaxID=6313 RepID=A0A0K0D8P0_ANGCA